LARRLCPHCKVATEIPAEAMLEIGFTELEIKEGVTLFEPKECSQCNKGYKGRIGLYEVMPVSVEIGKIIMAGGNAFDIANQMKKEGWESLRRAGLNKVKMGLTSLEEINRVTKE